MEGKMSRSQKKVKQLNNRVRFLENSKEQLKNQKKALETELAQVKAQERLREIEKEAQKKSLLRKH
jgi:outer membrane murein-binding lipoprotein Lpp